MKIFLLSFCVVVSLFGYSKADSTLVENEFKKALSKANAVILLDEQVFRVSEDKGEYFKKRKILIKNKKAEKYCKLLLSESKFEEYSDIEAVLTDTLGNIIKELDDDNIEEAAITPGFAFYDENIYKWFELSHKKYPFIFEYSYRLELESLFFWPGWYPQTEIPVISSKYKLVLEDDVKYKIHNIGLAISPERSKQKGDSVLIWQVDDIAPFKREGYFPPESKLQKAIRFAPINFKLGSSNGSFSDWNSVAKYFHSLYKNKMNITSEMESDIKKLISDKDNKHEIIQILYKYLQDKTRYVAIYLDIGGWEPHSIENVYKNRYGDCKDLSLLMISMLDVAGIKSYPALALTRSEGIVFEEFPSNQFNHCITFIPLEQDTVWLECTRDFINMEDTPYNIEGINALVVKEDGGELIKTPQKAASENKWHSIIKGNLDRRGSFTFSGIINLTGNQKNSFSGFAGFNKPEEIEKAITRTFNSYINTAEITAYSVNEAVPLKNPFNVKAEGEYKKFGKLIGKRIFINPNIFNRKTKNQILDAEERINPIYLNYPYVDNDSLELSLPRGYKLEAAPEPINIETPFSKFSTSFHIKEGVFYYVRNFEYSKKIIDQKYYNDFVEFINQVVKADQSKFIFKKG